MAWTNEQQAAINSRGQTLLLSAAAGSGKTAVLVERIIRRLLDPEDPVDITEMLVVTFTKAAAAEMRERIASALTNELAKHNDPVVEKQLALLPSAHISTLHSFCQNVIRRYFYMIDIDPHFTVAGDEELNLLRHSVMEKVFLSYYENEEKSGMLYPLADMFANDRGDDALMDTIEDIYEYSRSMPWPSCWLNLSVRNYDIPGDIPFDTLPWCGPVLQHIRDMLQEEITVYDQMIRDMEQRSGFERAVDQFERERSSMQHAQRCQTWSDMETAAADIHFERLTGLRSLSEVDKKFWKTCQDQRNKTKKQVAEKIQQCYFSVTGQEWIAGIRAMHPVLKGLVAITKDFSEAYAQAKKDKGWVDFSDLEHLCLQILLSPESGPDHPAPSPAAEELRDIFKEVLIDEYQDINSVQELITTLVSKENDRFMVGDIKQSIYRFRLADPTLFLDKYKAFSRDEKAARRCIDLSKNFRSAANILDAVNEVFARAMTPEAADMSYGDREKLYAGRPECWDDRWIGGPVEVHLLDTTAQDVPEDPTQGQNEEPDLTAFEQECLMVAHRLQELKDSHTMIVRKDGALELLTWKHMVILMRSMAGKADTMLQALQSAGIPVYAEQNSGYFTAVEVQIMLSLLRCIDNPEQDLAMAAVLRSPIVGMGETALAQLRLSGPHTLWRNLPDYIAVLPEGEGRDTLQYFCRSLEEWRTFSRRNSVADLLQRLYTDTAYFQYVGGMPGGAGRQANLQALYDRARQYEESGYRGIFRYLALIDKMQDDGLDLAPAKVLGESENVVRVMSIHKSKGLEFPVVVVADMGKSFNRQDTRSITLFHKTQGIGIKYYDPVWRMFYPTFIWNGIQAQLDRESKAEEERILYVAMTRARDKLILTGHGKLPIQWTSWAGGINPGCANCFLDWIMPVLADQVENSTIEEALQQGSDYQCNVGLWQLHVQHGVDRFAEAERGEEDPRFALLRDHKLTDTEGPEWLDPQLTWKYAYPMAVQTPAKFSVSEIKRRYSVLQTDESMIEERQLAVDTISTGEDSDVFGAVPEWLQEEEYAVTGAGKGTILHKVMQYAVISPDMTPDTLKHDMASWVAAGLFGEEEAAWVSVPAVVSFCRSDLGRRMAAASLIRREYPFSVLFGGGEYLPQIEEGERILVQGVVDCLFQEKDGWVLVDYKTDGLKDSEAFRKRYAVQIALYKKAMEQILGERVINAYIYSFHLHQVIDF